MLSDEQQAELVHEFSSEVSEITGQEQLLKIGQLASLCDKTVRALHLYEEMGLLEPLHRTKGGFRLYHVSAVQRVKWICRLQDADLSLGEIREFLQEISEERLATKNMERLQTLLKNKLSEVDDQMKRLVRLQYDLADGLRYLEACEVCDPARNAQDCKGCKLHGHTDKKPLMIAGLYSSLRSAEH